MMCSYINPSVYNDVQTKEIHSFIQGNGAFILLPINSVLSSLPHLGKQGNSYPAETSDIGMMPDIYLACSHIISLQPPSTRS